METFEITKPTSVLKATLLFFYREKNEKECIAELLQSHRNQAAKVDNETRSTVNTLQKKVTRIQLTQENESHESNVIKLSLYAKMPATSFCKLALTSFSNKLMIDGGLRSKYCLTQQLLVIFFVTKLTL